METTTLELYDRPSTTQRSLDGQSELRTYRYLNTLGALVYAPLIWGQPYVVQPVAYRGFDYVPRTLAGRGRQEVAGPEAVERLLRVFRDLPQP